MNNGMNNNQVYQYLCDNYDNITIKDGYYYAENSTECCYIPINYNPNSDINVYTFFPGDGKGSVGIAQNYAENNSFDNCAIFIAKNHSSQVNGNDVISSANSFAKANNMNISNLGVEAFSGSGGRAADALASYVSNNNHDNTNIKLLWTDAYTHTNTAGMAYKPNYNSYKILGENGVTLYEVTFDGSDTKESYTLAARQGLDVVCIKSNNNQHSSKISESYNNNMMMYLMGLTDELGGTYGDGKNSDYRAMRYDHESGNFSIPVNLADLHGKISSNNTKKAPKLDVDNIKFENLFIDDGFVITEQDSQVINKYNYLKDFSISNIDLSSASDSVTSNMSFVTSGMSNIVGEIKNSKFLNSNKRLNFRSSSGIPGCINAYLDVYYDIVGKLTSLLATEAESIISIGQAIVDMDTDIAKNAMQIGDSSSLIETVPIESNNSNLSNDTNETSSKDSRESISMPIYNNSNNQPVSNYVAPAPSSSTGPAPIQHQSQEPSPSTNTTKEQVVGERKDGSKIMISTDNNQITELKCLYEYDSVEEAQNMFSSFQDKYKDIDYIKEIKVNNNSIELIFNDEYYTNLNIEQIVNKLNSEI